MANFDKVILNGTTYTIPSGGGGTVDEQLSPTSTNAVQNKAIYGATNLYTYYSDESKNEGQFYLTQTENNEEYIIDIDLSNVVINNTYFYVYIPLNGSGSYQISGQDYMYLRFKLSDLSDLGYWDTTNDDIYASHTDITVSQSNGHVFVNIKPTAFDEHSNFLYGYGYFNYTDERYTKETDITQTGYMFLNSTVYYKYNTPVITPLTYYADELKKVTVDEVTGIFVNENYTVGISIDEKNLLTKKTKTGKTTPGFKLDNECFQYTSNSVLRTKYIFKSLSSQPSDTITQFESGVQLTNSFTTSTTGIKFYFKPENYGSLNFNISDNNNDNYLNITLYHYNNYTEMQTILNGTFKLYTVDGDLEDCTLFIDEISDTATFTSPYISSINGDLINNDGIEKIEIYNNCTIEPFQDKINRLEADKQDKLVSGTNIKTINNESILGEGNITIQGGGGTTYTAGEGIDITNDVISADTDEQNKVIASALTELHNDKADKNQLNNYQLKGDYVEQSAVDASIEAAVANYRTEAEAINVEKVDAAALTDLNARVTDLEQGGGGGGITGITMNGSAVTVTSGVANLGTVVTDKSDKQDTLVSGTNIKTINNESILGSGNITIQGGGTTYTAGDGIDITSDVISNTREQRVLTFEDSTTGVKAALRVISPHWDYSDETISDPANSLTFVNNVPAANADPYVQANYLDGTLMEFEITEYSESSSSSFEFAPDSVTGGVLYVYVDGEWVYEGYGSIYAKDSFDVGQKFRMNNTMFTALMSAMQADCPYETMGVQYKTYAWDTNKSVNAIHSGTSYPLAYNSDLTALAARVTALETALDNISSSLDTINGEVI